MEEKTPEYFTIPITKKHFGTMVHNVNTEKLREMLREKCRIRVREARHNKYDGTRAFLKNEKQWLTDILKGELSEFEMDILLEDKILDEMIEEQYQWMVEEYERSNDIDATAVKFLCPICQLSEFQCADQILHCKCGFQMNYNGSKETFYNKIITYVAQHETKCDSNLMFFMNIAESALNMMCDDCDFFALIQ